MIDLDIPFEKFIQNSDPLISVVVTSYNKAPYLAECVESFVAQTYKNFELLIVNDGSPDNTSEVVQDLIKRFPRVSISLLEKPNGGVSDARNYGLERAAGRLVMVIDGDDKVLPLYFERALAAFRETPGDIFRPVQQNFGDDNGQWNPEPYNPYFIRYSNCFPTPSLYDKRLFELTGGYKRCLSFCEDWEFWVNCSHHSPRVILSAEALTCWRKTDTGLHAEGVEGKWKEAMTSIVLLNEDLYSVLEVMEALEFVKKMDQSHIQKFEHLEKLHPKEWFPKCVRGIRAEASGQHEQALSFYLEAQKLAGDKNWVICFLLGQLCEQIGKKQEAMVFFQEVRILRPDMGPNLQRFFNQ